MIIIRPMVRKDLAAQLDFPASSIVGMTNLPRDRYLLEQKIIHTENCFKEDVKKPSKEEYYFVLEDLETEQVIGTCGILSENNLSRNYFYRIEKKETHAKYSLHPRTLKLMRAVPNDREASEVCSLFLLPDFRHGGYGRLLSLSRFLFMAAHPPRFEKLVVVELRGYLNQDKTSPFWEAVGRHFCNLSFTELLEHLERDRSILPELLPEFPIYIELLPKEVQEVIGKTHVSTQPAMSMLMQEGFKLTDEVDLFDGGPILSAPFDEIRSIKHSKIATVTITSEVITEGPQYVLGNEDIDFRACLGCLKMISPDEVLIQEEIAEALMIDPGQKVRYIAAR